MKTDIESSAIVVDDSPSPKQGKAPKPIAAPSVGDKFTGTYEDPLDLAIVGKDIEAPDGDGSPILHRVHQPERLRDILRDGVDDLVATILASGGKVLEPVEYVVVKVEGEARKVVATGRRRTLAARFINENRSEINRKRKEQGLDPIDTVLVKATRRDANDPHLWVSIRSENAGRMSESPLSVASDVALMLEGDPQLGIPKMGYEQIGALYGRNHQFARAMAKLDKASDRVKKALRQGKLSQTAAQELATIKDHDEQDARLAVVLEAEGGKVKVAKAITRKDKDKDEGAEQPDAAVFVGIRKLREAVRGIEEQLVTANKATSRGLIAASSALRWALGEEELDEDGAEEAWLLVANAQSSGESLMRLDRESATEADKAEKEAAKAAAREAKAQAKAEREAAKALAKAAEPPKKRGRPPKAKAPASDESDEE